MYNSGYGATSPPLTNNPFVSDPTNAQNRYPEISPPQSESASQFTSWLQPNGSGQPQNSMGYQPQQTGPSMQPQYQQPSPQPQFNQGYDPNAGYAPQQQSLSPQPTNQPFQPSSFFGQQMAGQITGSSYGYLQGQNTNNPSAQSYNPAQQQLQNNPGYIAQFDPYSSIGQGWGEGQAQNQQQQQQQQPSNQHPTSTNPPPPTTSSFNGNHHPREYLRLHKAEIESWDTYSWKQLLNSFDALKDAWEGRKRELEGKASQLLMQLQYGGGGYHPAQIQQEGSRLQGLAKEAQSNFDSVSASSFQIHEVFQSYRQSGDQASKRRVREASNAALQSLPDWPPQVY